MKQITEKSKNASRNSSKNEGFYVKILYSMLYPSYSVRSGIIKKILLGETGVFAPVVLGEFQNFFERGFAFEI